MSLLRPGEQTIYHHRRVTLKSHQIRRLWGTTWFKPPSNKARKLTLLPASRASPASQPPLHENPSKSLQIYEIGWKYSEDTMPAWNRAKVSIGAASNNITFSNTHARKPWQSMKIYVKPCIFTITCSQQSMNPWNALKYAESPQRTRSQPGIKQRFL